jgi:MT-A70
MAPVGEHSEKPEEVRRRIERLFPGPYLELFARKPVDGWAMWGNEIPRDAIAAPIEAPASPAPDDLDIPDFLRRASPARVGGTP